MSKLAQTARFKGMIPISFSTVFHVGLFLVVPVFLFGVSITLPTEHVWQLHQHYCAEIFNEQCIANVLLK